jgi:general stress protein YciG
VIGNAVKVVRIATGEDEEDFGNKPAKNEAAAELGRKGGAARAKSMSPERRAEIAKRAAEKRWKKGG